MAVKPVSAVPLSWQCSTADTDQTLFVTLDKATAMVKWTFKPRGHGRMWTETAAFTTGLVQWAYLLPATTVRMHHRLDLASGELLVTQGDSGKRRRWLCVVDR